MVSRISHTTIDCRDAYALSEWWRQVLGYVDDPDDPNEPGHEECLILDPAGPHRVLFIEVPEAKSVKNRIHFDLRPQDRTQAEEIERLVSIGATALADLRRDDGGWVTLADPEGNEFCVLMSPAERDAVLAARA
ncbi:glyoxalase [Frondihabitans sucicola]|uniref:Glyoxalase n=1 Tax=Frondihabitans sucicola TaxID=1268041 RepID=A0ABM8GNI9_9MICO|nr:VOC family protein [Frondihabitans sucicola]BDZ50004.1 glyoxalase [Frondihabitans sucicola]